MMQNRCEGGLAVASVQQEIAFIEKALREWQSLNIAGRSTDSQREAAETALRIFSSFMVDPEHGRFALIEGADPNRLRAVLGALVAVAWSTATSGLAQAWVHVGLAHRDRIDFVWHPDRLAKLSDFTRDTIRTLDNRIMALDGLTVSTTLH